MTVTFVTSFGAASAAGDLANDGLGAITIERPDGWRLTLNMGMDKGGVGGGESNAVKAFHTAGGKPNAPFSAVNCATMPKDLAERLLFGSQRGAFSGATDATGHVQAADGGALFLDEVAELPLDVQSKLLRMLETREVLRLGSTAYERVDVRVCAGWALKFDVVTTRLTRIPCGSSSSSAR